jgi:DUF1009 family protein
MQPPAPEDQGGQSRELVPPSAANSRIGILAGGGRLPLSIAESVVARGGAVHIVGIEGEADAAIARFPHTWVKWGQIGRMVDTLHREAGPELVIAGGVRRPNLKKLRPDLGFLKSLPKVLGLLAGGDDSVLTRVVRFFEANGFVVLGAHEVAPELLVQTGAIGAAGLSASALADADIGFAVRALLGPLDAGQAVAVSGGRVLAIEGAEGTDAMLERVSHIRRELSLPNGGVLAKGPKSGQELRIDMPVVGPRTVELGQVAGFDGCALEAGGVLILDRDEMARLADAKGFAVAGLPAGAQGAHIRQPLREVTGKLVARRQPSPRDRTDAALGLAAEERLAAYGAGHAVVVMSSYVVAIAAAETVASLLERVRALRQWGIGERRRRGVLVYRAAHALPEGGLPVLFAIAAAQGLAGLAVVGGADALVPFEEEGPALADAAGLFLITCPRPA